MPKLLLSTERSHRINTCAYNHCYIAISFKAALVSFGMFWGLFGLFLHWSKNYIGNSSVAEKYEWSITSYIGIQFFFNWQYFQRLHLFFLIFKSLLLLFYCNNHGVIVLIKFICFCIYISIIISLFIFFFFFFL